MDDNPFAILEERSVLGLFPSGVETLPQALLAAGLAERLDARYEDRIDARPYEYRRDPATLLHNPRGIADYSVALSDGPLRSWPPRRPARRRNESRRESRSNRKRSVTTLEEGVMHPQKSPRIVALSWGRMEVDGIGAGKDFKLWPGGGRQWDWRETNTHHVPGIQRADVEELLEHGSRTIVLSQGMLRMLHTCPETLAMLQRQHIDVRVEETGAAAETYNRLAARGEQVGGLFHSTC